VTAVSDELLKGIVGGTGLLLAVVTFVVSIARLVRRQRRHVDQWRRRPPVSDAEFARACDLVPGTPQAAHAVAVRRACANVIAVPAETIRADDRLDDPIWDSIGLIELVMELEETTGVDIPDSALDAAFANGPAQTRVRDVIEAIAGFGPLFSSTSRSA
jgi:acyl carrier protein